MTKLNVAIAATAMVGGIYMMPQSLAYEQCTVYPEGPCTPALNECGYPMECKCPDGFIYSGATGKCGKVSNLLHSLKEKDAMASTPSSTEGQLVVNREPVTIDIGESVSGETYDNRTLVVTAMLPQTKNLVEGIVTYGGVSDSFSLDDSKLLIVPVHQKNYQRDWLIVSNDGIEEGDDKMAVRLIGHDCGLPPPKLKREVLKPSGTKLSPGKIGHKCSGIGERGRLRLSTVKNNNLGFFVIYGVARVGKTSHDSSQPFYVGLNCGKTNVTQRCDILKQKIEEQSGFVKSTFHQYRGNRTKTLYTEANSVTVINLSITGDTKAYLRY